MLAGVSPAGVSVSISQLVRLLFASTATLMPLAVTDPPKSYLILLPNPSSRPVSLSMEK